MRRIQFLLILAYTCCAAGLSAQWQLQNTGFPDSLREVQAIWAVNENIVWAVASWAGTGDSTVQEFTRTLNGGQQWTAGNVPGLSGYASSMIFALDEDSAWIAFHHPDLSGGKIMHTANGGQSWTHQSTALFTSASEAYPNLVYFWDAQQGFLMGDPTDGYFEIYTTLNGGALWTRVDSVNIPPVLSGEYGYEREFTVIGDAVWFGTSKGRIYRSADRGAHWSVINTPFLGSGGRCRITEYRDPLHGIVCDRNGSLAVMYETNDGGASWQAISPVGTAYGRYLEYIPGTDSTYISSSNSGADQGVSISYDDGHHWMPVTASLSTGYGVMSFPNPLAGWAGQMSLGGGQGGILKYVGNTVGNTGQVPTMPRIYPNPCRGQFWLEDAERNSPATLSLLDLSGRRMLQARITESPQSVDVEGMAPGLYLLEFSTDDRVWTGKVILR
ncbi:MAG TPA: T9SS type A sorting domain-containing protein [Bacteroidales bacterium]|nr:T9SS type A sorting domain-containing protein [Bacteroidales bacterium]HRZ76055.1 T9SS type A sorting domain-containing protein [Bacteroidales bacterium]